jgi:hypothetical protein
MKKLEIREAFTMGHRYLVFVLVFVTVPVVIPSGPPLQVALKREPSAEL